MDTLSVQAIVSYLVVQFVAWLKRSSLFPWIGDHTAGLNRCLAATLAALAAIGINFHYDAAAGSLLITGLTLTSIATFVVEWLRGWIMQELLYGVLKGKLAPEGPMTLKFPR